MKTRRLGKTELEVSEIGFGGEWLERHPEEESIELIRYASSKGVNCLTLPLCISMHGRNFIIQYSLSGRNRLRIPFGTRASRLSAYFISLML